MKKKLIQSAFELLQVSTSRKSKKTILQQLLESAVRFMLADEKAVHVENPVLLNAIEFLRNNLRL